MLLQHIGIPAMSDDIPEPDRTVTVEEAHLLRAQVEHSEEQASQGDEINQKYHEERVQYTRERINQIESQGISESDLEDTIEELREQVEDTEPDTDERIPVEAKLDTDQQINERYFDNGPDEVVVECVGLTGYDNGAVEFKDGSGRAIVEFPSEADARGAADAILSCNGIEEEGATVGMR
jgi:hypothetical protein